ncbi:aminodeoxychorismate lyase [Alteromonas sp. S167]|uniref:aminodeoxychorismate lyase n=1 Tax=Alteromonas sp. S167 TaxID=3117402 RepID=UPI002FE15FB1
MKIVSSDAPILQSDRAYNYGDGVFTTIRVLNHTPELLPWHLSRLSYDTSALDIHIDIERLQSAIIAFIAEQREKVRPNVDDLTNDVHENDADKNKHQDNGQYVLKVHISGGEAGRGYARDQSQPSLVRLSVHAYPKHYDAMRQRGINAISANTALAIQPVLAGIKHMNRLEQVLIKREVEEAGADDAIVCDTNENLIEASAGNLFFFANGAWYTPSLKGSGVNGVVRQCLVQGLLNDNVTLNVGEYSLEQLKAAQAVVITNALMGIMPVSSVTFHDSITVKYAIEHAEIEYLHKLLNANKQARTL